MASIFQIKRGTTQATLADGELYLHKDIGTLQISNGADNPLNLLPLDTEINGNIILQGNITASNAFFTGDVAISGNLFLGNNQSDNINALGVFTSNLTPGTTNTYSLGTTTAVWSGVYGNVISGSHITGSFYGNTIGTGSYAILAATASSAENFIIRGYTDYNIAIATPSHLEGRVHWSTDTNTLQIDTDVNNFMLEVGHTNVVKVVNRLPYTVTKGTIVYISGSQGNRPGIATASYENDTTSANTVGIVALDISSNNNGYVVTSGLLRNQDTSLYAAGTQLYLSSSGKFTNTPAVAPLHTVRLGKVVVQSNGNGVIYVQVQNGYELDEIHDVLIQSPANQNILTYNSTIGVWENKTTGFLGLATTASLNIFSGSQITQNTTLQNTTASIHGVTSSLNTYTQSQNTKNTDLGTYTSSLESKNSTLATYTGSINTKFTDLATYTGSNDTKWTTITNVTSSLISYTGSQNTKNTDLGTYTGSINTKFTSLSTYTGSVDTKFTTLSTYTGSINTKFTDLATYTGSVDTKWTTITNVTSSILSYTSSLKTAFSASGQDLIIYGNLTVQGTQTTLNTNELVVEDLFITLASGSTTPAAANGAGIYIQGADVSMSWDNPNSVMTINKPFYVTGQISASSIVGLNNDTVTNYSTSVDSRLVNLQLTSASVSASLFNINNYTTSQNTKNTSLGTYTGSIDDKFVNLATYTGSVDSKFTSVSTITSSLLLTASAHETKNADLATYTGSVNAKFTSLATYTGSIENKFTSLATYTGSIENKFTSLATYTGSIENKFVNLATYTGSNNTKWDTISNVTSSLISNTGSVNSKFVDLSNYTGSIDSKFISLATYTGSIETKNTTLATYTGSINTKNDTLENVTASLLTFSGSILTYTSSTNNRLDKLETTSGSTNNSISKLNQFTSSLDAKFVSIEGATSSLFISTSLLTQSFTALKSQFETLNSSLDPDGITEFRVGTELFTGSMLTQSKTLENVTSSLLAFTNSTDLKFTSLSTTTGSIETRFETLRLVTASVLDFTGSTKNRLTDLETTASFTSQSAFLFTSLTGSFFGLLNDLANKTGSYATTGSNLFIGVQTISGSVSISGSFTASLQDGYAWVGTGNGIAKAVATASFSTLLPTGILSSSNTDFESYTSSLETRLNFIENIQSNTEIKGRNIVSSSTDTENVDITINNGIISANLYGGVVSQSVQVLGGTNIVSSSTDTANVDITITNGVISANLYGGVVSQSSQISIAGTSDYDAFNTTLVKTTDTNQTILGVKSFSTINVTTLNVSGEATYTTTNNLAIGDNIILLNNAGDSGVRYAGVQVVDKFAPDTALSGSLIWDGSRNKWVAGQANTTSDFANLPVILTDGLGIISGAINTWTGSLNTWTGGINTFTGAHNAWTGGVNIWTSSINNWTGSNNYWTGGINTWTGSLNIWTSSFNTWTGSVINVWTASINNTTASLNAFTASLFTKGGALVDYTNGVTTTAAIAVFRAPWACKAMAVRGRYSRAGATSSEVHFAAVKSGSIGRQYLIQTGSQTGTYGFPQRLSGSSEIWQDATITSSATVVTFAAGDTLEIIITGSNLSTGQTYTNQVAVQVDFIRL